MIARLLYSAVIFTHKEQDCDTAGDEVEALLLARQVRLELLRDRIVLGRVHAVLELGPNEVLSGRVGYGRVGYGNVNVQESILFFFILEYTRSTMVSILGTSLINSAPILKFHSVS